MHRRELLKGAAAGLVALPHLDLRGLGAPPAPTKTTVAVIRTSDRRDGVRRAMALLDPQGIAGKAVNLKPNFNTADPAPAGTHNDTLAQLVTELNGAGCASNVVLGESSFPPTRQVMEDKGILDLASDMGFGVVSYDEIPDAEWVHFQPAGTHWPEGFPSAAPCGGVGVPGQHLLPQDPRLWWRVHDVAQAVGRGHAEEHPARDAPLTAHAPHDCRAEPGLRAAADRHGRHRGIHGRRPRRAARSRSRT